MKNEEYGPDSKIYRQFVEYHTRNSHVYWTLVGLAREWKQAGNTRIGMKMLFEVARWTYGLRPAKDVEESFVLNNNYTAYYARLIMKHEADLVDFFEVRELRAQ